MRIHGRRLEPGEFDAFEKALEDVFSLDEFKGMLRRRLGWRNLPSDDEFFTKMIDRAENDEETLELLKAALEEKPHSSLLHAFAQQVGVLPSTPAPPGASASSPTNSPTQFATETAEKHLERKVNALGSSLEPAQWRKKMEQRERQICRIVIQGWDKYYGTGFLLGADVVMTNYHVLQDVIEGSIPPHKVSLYFDYKLKEDGKTLEEGSEHQLAAEGWRLSHSEYSDLDKQSTEHCADVDERLLDFVLLRLKEKAGEERIEGEKRGWIEIPELDYDFQMGTSLFILHHPYGGALKFDFDTSSIVEVNANKTRVRYKTNTESGSSGAPCFTMNWDLVAIHQSGEPDFTHSARYNQGIPIFTILRRLKKYGTDKYLGSSTEGEAHSSPNESPSPEQPVTFAAPENMLSSDEQQLLISLLEKEGLATFATASPTSFTVTREMMEHISSKYVPAHFYCLLKGYKRIILSLVEQARNPFFASTDHLPIHLRLASEQLDLLENCVRKTCVLLKHAILLLDVNTVIQVTVEADIILEAKERICQLLNEERRKYDMRSSNKIKINIKNELTNFVKKVHEFLHKLPEG